MNNIVNHSKMDISKLCEVALCNFAFSDSLLIRLLIERGEAIRDNDVKLVQSYNDKLENLMKDTNQLKIFR